MTDQRPTIDLGFTSETVPAGTHMCLIYSTEEERETVLARLLERGRELGERTLYLADGRTPEAAREWLFGCGFGHAHDPATDVQFAEALPTYCPHGRFNPQEMLDTMRDFYVTARRDGYPGARGSGEMTWALRGIPGADRLMEYEARLNLLFQDYPMTAVCQYDARQFDGATILDVLRVHPMMIVHGNIVRNPYFLRPEVFLRDFAARV